MSTLDRPTVLIVEDEPLVRMHGCDVLEDAGFAVLEAETADEAVTLLERHDGVRLLFSDIDMPGSMDGLELAALVYRRWPDVAILVTSGRRSPGDGAVPANGRFIAKPWRETVVLGEIRAILAGQRAHCGTPVVQPCPQRGHDHERPRHFGPERTDDDHARQHEGL